MIYLSNLQEQAMSEHPYRAFVIKQPNGKFALFSELTNGIFAANRTSDKMRSLLLQYRAAEEVEEAMKAANEDREASFSAPEAPIGYHRFEGAIARYKEHHGRAAHDDYCAIAFDRS